MKKILLISVIFVGLIFAGTPTIDGTFDGTGVWGSAIATADGTPGWNSASAIKLYATFDDNFYYFGAEISTADWNDWGFLINTSSGGGGSEPWGRAIDFGHTDLPDYVIKGHFGDPNDNGSNSPYAELRSWNGSSWVSTAYTSNIGENETAFIEVKVAKADIGNPTSADVQFYITGNNSDHATFDACPDDEIADSWLEGSSHTILNNYVSGIALPVELTNFSVKAIGKNIHLTWSTATETNNAGFEIERQDKTGNAWSKIAFIEGHGTTSSPKEYSYVDSKVSGGNYSYRLKQVDRDGKFEYSQSVEVNIGLTAEDFQLSQNYPNPFNPSTQIQFAVPQSEFVSLRVYNTLGQEVRTLFNGIAEGNTMQKVEFDGSTLPSGVYFYSLKTKDRHEVKKLSLMK